MNDIDTIRKALRESQQIVGAFKAQYDAQQSLRNALAALERVSALQAEMEAALDSIGEHLSESNAFSNRFVTTLAALQVKRRGSR